MFEIFNVRERNCLIFEGNAYDQRCFAQVDQFMLITSHNIFWFQGYPAENDMQDPVTEPVYQALLKLYKKMNPDLMLLQEIQSAQIAQRFAHDLKMNHFFQQGQELTRYGGAVFFKDDIVCQINSSTPKNGFQRLLQCFEIQHKQHTLKFCNLHLPSTRQLNIEEACAKRIEEVKIAMQLKPDFICGDFNEAETGGVHALLTQNGFIDTILKNSKRNSATTFKGKRGDFAFIKNEKINLLKSFEIIDLNGYKIQSPNDTFISDHFPLLLRIIE